MLFVEIVLFAAAATGAGFLIARFVLAPPAAHARALSRWRTEAEHLAAERDRLEAEVQDLRAALHEERSRPGGSGGTQRDDHLPDPCSLVVPEAPPALAAPAGEADDLKRIVGIGPGIERSLNEVGIWHFRQLAALRPEQVAWLEERLPIRGRIRRQAWIDQAEDLARGAPTDAAA